MIAPGIPSEFGGQAMILMSILQPMREDDIRVDLFLQIFEIALHIDVLCWQVSRPGILQ